MMDGRDTFLSRARDDHWEFSSLRRAKYSTLCLCFALHENDSAKETAYCNKCNNVAKFHCNTCDDFDLCEKCNQTIKHEHPMEQIKSLIGDSGGEAGGGNRYESIQRCIQSLVHACQCRDANCRRMSCHKMKRVVQHTKMCKKRVNASCPVCKQLIALCCYHAKHCTRDSCSVPFCMNIRQKLAEQKRLSARRADMMMRRRMEGLHAGVGGGNANTAANTTAPSTSSAVSASSTTPPAIVSSISGAAAKKGGGVQNATPFGAMHSHHQQQLQNNPMLGGNQQNQPPRVPTGMMGMGQMGGHMGMQPNRGFPGPGGGMQQPFGGAMTGTGMMAPAGRGQQPPNAGGMAGMQGRMPGGGQQQTMMNPPPYRPPNNGAMGGGHYPQGQTMSGMPQSMPGGGMAGQMPGGMTREQINDERVLMEQMRQLETRLLTLRSQEERDQFYQELKRKPLMFSAFLKMSRNQEGQRMFPTATAYLQRESSMMMMGQHPSWQQQQQYGHRPGQPSGNVGPFPGMPGRQGPPGLTPQMMPPQGQDPSTYR